MKYNLTVIVTTQRCTTIVYTFTKSGTVMTFRNNSRKQSNPVKFSILLTNTDCGHLRTGREHCKEFPDPIHPIILTACQIKSVGVVIPHPYNNHKICQKKILATKYFSWEVN